LHRHLILNIVKLEQIPNYMNQTVEKIRWNIYDLDVLPQNEFNKYEIIDGELFVTKAPHRRHQQICGKIF